MKQRYIILTAAIAAALASPFGTLLAQSLNGAALTSISTTESSRVTRTVTNSDLVTLAKSHLAFVVQIASSSAPLPGTAAMNHLQLILKPSAARTAALETLVASQHDPHSAQFDHWLTPQQFGASFGVVANDVVAVTAWLTAQGFTVNSVYPNQTQIDFSGTASLVDQAFHTQEGVYTINGTKYLANATDVSIPAALQPVVAGVLGLNNFQPTASARGSQIAQWSASKKGFVAQAIAGAFASSGKTIGQAVRYPITGPAGSTERGLVPNDLATMYGIRTIRANGVTGKGVTIAVVGDEDMVPGDWSNFVSTFNLAQYGGTFEQINPAPSSGTNNCLDPDAVNSYDVDDPVTLSSAEWTTALAPGANIVVATCASENADYIELGNPYYGEDGGAFIAATNLINGNSRPDIISYGFATGESGQDSASKAAIDAMWAQADAEGISVFVAAGDYGQYPTIGLGQYGFDQYQAGGDTLDANAYATSPHDTAVGGTDIADILDGTTSQYFAAKPSVVGGSALSYVPEIPWNASCGNGVAAKANGFSSATAFCQNDLKYDPHLEYLTDAAGSSGASSMDAKPEWQQQVYNAAKDQSRDIPDIALFAGSYGDYTKLITCTSAYPCTPEFAGPVALDESTVLSTAMFAGIQALMDQGLHARGLPLDQGNAAPTLYALAANEYGGATGPAPASLAACSADNGVAGTANCVFHDVTRGSNSTPCLQTTAVNGSLPNGPEPNCYFYGEIGGEYGTQLGLTTTDASPASYSPSNKAYGAQPGWSFTSGLGSVNATNLLIAWRAFDHAASATSASP